MHRATTPSSITGKFTIAPPFWRLALLLLVGIASVVLTIRAKEREKRLHELTTSVVKSGGTVHPDWPAWRYAWEWWQGQSLRLGTEVIFRRNPSRRPRDELGDLHGLDIRCLYVTNGALTGDEVARLVPAHPIELLRLTKVTGTDAVAHALRESTTLRLTSFDDSDLSDTGLRELPLERIETLFVNGTEVSTTGLQELRRAERLWCLLLDGGQFNAESVEIVKRLPKLRILGLNGAAVTDEHLQLIHGLNLEKIHLENTTVTPAGIASLKQALPSCVVEVR
ncbi:MAG: hypothetical protein JNG89_02795 [Planctomycetaceae bacterium]|nr:hypothetical protein [Planctomycetaceae bacterium]